MAILFQIPAAMLNSIWFMSILFSLYVLLKFFLKLSPARSFLLAVGFECIATIHFIYSIFHTNYYSFKITTIAIQSSSNWINWTPLIGIVYAIALIAYLTYLLFDFKQINQLRNNADYTNNQYWNQLLQKLGLDKYLIGTSAVLKAPITFGWMDTVILLPISILNHLSIEEVKYILLHEVAHIIRHDFIVQLFIKLCHSILLFNPFSYFFTKEINIQRELACDAWVLERLNNPIAYSKSLYQLALVAHQEQNELTLNAIGSEKEMLTRIQFLNKLPLQSSRLFKQLAFACIVLLVTSIGFTTNTLTKTDAIQKSQVLNNYRVASSVFPKRNKQVQVNSTSDPIIKISTLKAPITPTAPLQEEEYTAAVSKAANWIKERENPYQFVNYSASRDSLEFEVAEKLLLRSLIQNYQLRKELLNAKLATIASEREALDFLENSKEWKEVLQYENWASTFLKRHPEVTVQDSLRRF